MADESELDYEEGEQTTEAIDQTVPSAAAADDEGLPVYEGAVFGVGAFLVGYIATFLLTNSQITAMGVELESSDPSSWKLAAWSFLGSQGVGLEQGGDPTSMGQVGIGPNTLTLLLPIVLLATAGYGLVKYTEAGNLQEAVKTSLLVIPGYLVLALVLTLLSGHEANSISTSLATGDAILYAGILYPAIFGIVGGLLATWPEPVDAVLEQIESRT